MASACTWKAVACGVGVPGWNKFFSQLVRMGEVLAPSSPDPHQDDSMIMKIRGFYFTEWGV